MAALYVSSHVRHLPIDGRLVLLDLRNGKYVIFGREAAAMWGALVSADSHQERLSILEQEFDVPASKLEADFKEFTRDCLARGYLQDEIPNRDEPVRRLKVHRHALTLRAWRALLLTTRALAWRGFAQTYQDYSRLAKPSRAETELDALVSRAEGAFSRAENFFVIHNAPKDCLPRSLALYRFLLSTGVPAEHVIGVQSYPSFQAHAWVECRGRVLCDARDYVSCFSELARI